MQGGHKRIQEVTGGYSWLKGATTSGYRVTGNYRFVLFILELLHSLLFCILFTERFIF